MQSIRTTVKCYSVSITVFLAVSWVLPSGIDAKTLYVDSARGNDSTTYANNDAANPWRSIGRAAWGTTNPASTNAAQAAQAGDTVLVTAGTYTTVSTTTACGSGARYNVALNPVNSGTTGNPITFRASGTVTVLLGASYAGPTIGSNARDYIVWDGFTINEAIAPGASCADTGPVVLYLNTGSQIINSSITGTYRAWSDNYVGVRLDFAINPVVRNNTITAITCNFRTNCAGVMLYDTQGAIIEHNDISNCATGIYVKGDHEGDAYPQQNNTVRFNRLHDITSHGVGLGAANGTNVYQNIIKGVSIGVRFYDFGAPQSSNITIQNNTFIATNAGESGISYAGTTNISNARIFNNIFYSSYGETVNIGLSALGSSSYEHNMYFGYNAWGSVAGAQRTFATWRGTFLQDSATPAGSTSNPSFVNEIDYRLNVGSPAASLGVDILDLNRNGNTNDVIPAGAYVAGSEVIGLLSSPSAPSDATPPQSPINLRVQ